MRLSEDPVATAPGHVGVRVTLNTRVEAAIIDRIPTNSQLCTVRLEGFVKLRRN